MAQTDQEPKGTGALRKVRLREPEGWTVGVGASGGLPTEMGRCGLRRPLAQGVLISRVLHARPPARTVSARPSCPQSRF